MSYSSAMPIRFKRSEHLTLGVEVELQLIHPETLDLFPSIRKVLKHLSGRLKNRIKPEIMQSMVEINTDICRSAFEVQDDLYETLNSLRKIAERENLYLATTGGHPFARHIDRKIFPSKRYLSLIDRNQWIGRRLMIFGVHVHLGMKSPEHCIAFNNMLMHYLPLFLGLSSSSPFWQGEDTGLASCRVLIFEACPSAGHPYLFRDWTEFSNFIDTIVNARSITSIKDLWWDIRPSPTYGTLEIRICDGFSSMQDLTSFVALVHALALWMDERLMEGIPPLPPPDWLNRDNKWRVSRHGLNADLIVNSEGRNMSFIDFALNTIDMIDPAVRKLKYKPFMNHILRKMLKSTSSDRQREVFRSSGSLKDVTLFNIEELRNSRRF